MELSEAEGRVLGSLIEKQLTTPQLYPLTDNALITACNQMTSRDPVVSFDVTTVRLAVRTLREKELLRTVHRTGERSDKHQHQLDTQLALTPGQLALLAVLLLRGPQTAAELRTRTERMCPFTTLAQVEQELGVLSERDEPVVVLLARQPGHKDLRYAQLLTEGPAVRDLPGLVPVEPMAPTLTELAREVALLRQELAAVRHQVEMLVPRA